MLRVAIADHIYPVVISIAFASVLEHVIQDFLDRTEGDFAANQDNAPENGVQWDALFLPHGTQIRTKYFGKYPIAEVVAGEILWEGQKSASMSQLARAMRGKTSNNAWIVLELKRPTDRMDSCGPPSEVTPLARVRGASGSPALIGWRGWPQLK